MLSRRCSIGVILAGLSLALVLALPVPAGAGNAAESSYSAQFNQFAARFSGKVTDVEGNPLAGVQIVFTLVIPEPGRVVEPVEVTTDAEGSYFARELYVDRTRITATLEGYMPFVVEQDVRPGPNTLDIVLQPPGMSDEMLRATEAGDAYELGVAAFEAGDHEQSIRLMEQARSSIDDNEQNNHILAAVSQNLGNSYMALGQYEKAKAEFQEWLRRLPDDADARLALAQAYKELGDEEAAAAEVEAAKATGAEDPESHYNMGAMMIESGDVEGGIAELEMAVQLRPVFPVAHKNLGYAYARTGEYQKAVEHFELFLEQDPDSPEAADVQQFVAALKDMIG